MTLENTIKSVRQKFLLWLYPYKDQEFKVDLLFKIVFTAVLVVNILSFGFMVYSIIDIQGRRDTQAYEILMFSYSRILIASLFAVFGAFQVLRLNNIGWIILLASSIYGIVRSANENLVENISDFGIGLINPVLNLLLIAYMIFGKPVKALGVKRKWIWIPLLIGVSLYMMDIIIWELI